MRDLAACRFFSYGLEKNFRPDVYEEFEKRTLQVLQHIILPNTSLACTGFCNAMQCHLLLASSTNYNQASPDQVHMMYFWQQVFVCSCYANILDVVP